MKPKAAKTGAEPNGEPALADVKITAKSEAQTFCHDNVTYPNDFQNCSKPLLHL